MAREEKLNDSTHAQDGKGSKGFGKLKQGWSKMCEKAKGMNVALKIALLVVLGVLVIAVVTRMIMGRKSIDPRLVKQGQQLFREAEEQYQLAHQDYNAIIAFQHNAAAAAAVYVILQLFGEAEGSKIVGVDLHQYQARVRQQAREIREVLGQGRATGSTGSSNGSGEDALSSPSSLLPELSKGVGEGPGNDSPTPNQGQGASQSSSKVMSARSPKNRGKAHKDQAKSRSHPSLTSLLASSPHNPTTLAQTDITKSKDGPADPGPAT
jgi:flagellar basal body-associated protein FliL